MRFPRLPVLPVLVASAVGCGASPGQVVQPKEFTGAEAMGGEAVKCGGSPKFMRPYTVDLDTDTRVDLESQMRKGLVVVAYDCASLKVLPRCSAAGTYEYAGVTPKEDVVTMKGLNELKTNLPIGAAKLSAEVKSGRTIELGLVSVGRQSTTVASITKGQLSGDCTGATHFVQRATLGAFTLATGTEGKVSAVADLFSAGASGASSAERTVAKKDGSLDACRKAQALAPQPPEHCGTSLRVDLEPLAAALVAHGDDDKKKPTAKPVEGEKNPCAPGLDLVGGICATKAATAFLCDPTNEAECRAQCDKGNGGSCTSLGALVWKAKGGSARAALPFYKKACDLGHVEGCGGYATALLPDDVKDAASLAKAKEAIALGKKACTDGSAAACVNTGIALWNGSSDEKTMPTDPQDALPLLERGCALGDGWGCASAAQELWDPRSDTPRKVKADPARAVSLAMRGCQGGAGYVCTQAAEWLAKGSKVARDPARAVAAAKLGCELDAEECGSTLSYVKAAGDDAAYLQIAKRGCETKDKNRTQEDACLALGDAYLAGQGTAKDPAKAKEAWTAGCEARKRETPTSWAGAAVCKRLK